MKHYFSKSSLNLNFFINFTDNSFGVRRFCPEEHLLLFRILPQVDCLCWTPWRSRRPPEWGVGRWRNLVFRMVHIIHPLSSPMMICGRRYRGPWCWSGSLSSGMWLSVGPPTGGRLITRGGWCIQHSNPPSHPSSPDQLVRLWFERFVYILNCFVFPDELLRTLDAVQGEENTQCSRQEEVQSEH